VTLQNLSAAQKEVLELILTIENKNLDQYATVAVLSFLEASIDAIPDNLREKMGK
jgi:hypothetical protein